MILIQGSASLKARIRGEVPAGLINGINNTYTTLFNFVPVTLIVYLNGLRHTAGKDYLSAGTNSFTFFIAPGLNDSISIDYQRST